MLLICQSNMQAVTKIRHLLETGNTPGEAELYLVTLYNHWCTYKNWKESKKILSWQPISLSEVLQRNLWKSLLQGNVTELWLLIPSLRLRSLTSQLTGPPLQSKNIVTFSSQEINVLIFSYISRKFFFFSILFSERTRRMVKIILCLHPLFFSPIPVLRVTLCQYSSNVAHGLSQTLLIFE